MKTKKKPAKVLPPQPENHKISWPNKGRPEAWGTAKVLIYETECNRYRAYRIESTLDANKDSVYFGACYNDPETKAWLEVEHDPKLGSGYPKHYKSLDDAMQACEIRHAICNESNEVSSNRRAVASAAEKADKQEKENEVMVAKKQVVEEPVAEQDPFVIPEGKARGLLESLGLTAAKRKDVFKLISDSESLAAAPKEPTGSNMKLFKALCKALSDGRPIEVAMEVEGSEEAAPVVVVKNGTKEHKEEKVSKKKQSQSGKKSASQKSEKVSSKTKPSKTSGGMSGLDAAFKILNESKKPLTPEEIVDIATKKNYWHPKTSNEPWKFIGHEIGREIRSKGKDARFVKAEERGKFLVAK